MLVLFLLASVQPAMVAALPPGQMREAYQGKIPDRAPAGLDHLRLFVFFTGGHSITGSSTERKFLKHQFQHLSQKPSTSQAPAPHTQHERRVLH